MEKVRHLGTELACAFWCSALQQRYRNAPAQVLLRLVQPWNMPSCIAASMSSQFISILHDIFLNSVLWTTALDPDIKWTTETPNTAGMKDPALACPISPQQSKEIMKSLDVIGIICYLQCAIRPRGTVPDFVEVSSTTPFLEADSKHPQYAWMYHDEFMMYLDVISLHLISFDALSIQPFNSSSYKYSSQSYQRACASTKGVYTARDRWSKHQYLKYLPRPSRACFNVTKCEQNITELSWEGQPSLETALLPNWWPLVKPCVKSSANLRIVKVKGAEGAGPWVNCGKNEASCICPGHCECSPTQWLKYDCWICNKFNPWYSTIMNIAPGRKARASPLASQKAIAVDA